MFAKYSECQGAMIVDALQSFRQKLLVIKPNSRTRLEILRKLLKFIQSKGPDVIDRILTPDFNDLLSYIWRALRTESGRSLSGNSCSVRVKRGLHEVSLQILDLILQRDTTKFLSLGVIHTEEIVRLLDLIDYQNKHVYCCLDDVMKTWTLEQTKLAHQQLFEVTLVIIERNMTNKRSRYGDIFDAVLATQEGLLVSELLAESGAACTLHFREYAPDILNNVQTSTERCRVSYVISPQYVWVQMEEDWDTLDKIQHQLNNSGFSLTSLAPDYTDEAVIVRLASSGFTFRARILEGSSPLQDTPVQVLAIDFGWTCKVRKKELFQAEKVLGLSHNFTVAQLCRLPDVMPPISLHTSLVLGSLRVLYRITQHRTWAQAALTDPLHRELLLNLLYNTQDLDTARHTLHVLANGAADNRIGSELLEPVTSHAQKFIDCVDVMRPLMLFYRTIVRNSEKVAKKLVKGPGMGVVMEIYSAHSSDALIKEHFADIAKEVFKGHEIGMASSPIVDTCANVPDVSSTPRTSSNNHAPHAFPSFTNRFSALEKMGSHGIHVGEKCAFVANVQGAHYERQLACEIYSMLNHKGGEIFVGVAPESGIVRGMKLDRGLRDEINLLVDDIITDEDLFKRSKGGKIPQKLVDVGFEKINNTHNQRTQCGEDLMLFKIAVKPLPPKFGLVMFNSTQDRKAVEYDKSKFEWTFYNRDSNGLRVMSLNEVRQRMAESLD